MVSNLITLILDKGMNKKKHHLGTSMLRIFNAFEALTEILS